MKQHGAAATRAALAELQRHAWATVGKNPVRYREAASRAQLPEDMALAMGLKKGSPEFREVIAQYRHDIDPSDLPTSYEDPGFYNLIADAAQKLEAAAIAIGHPVAFRPLFATLPSGRVNACVIYVPEPKEFIVALEWGFFSFANLFSKVVAKGLALEQADDSRGQWIDLNPTAIEARLNDVGKELGEDLVDVIGAIVVHGDPYRARQYFVDPAYATPANLLRTSLEYFVLAHEYGHILAGHLSRKRARLRALPEAGSSEVILSWKQELEADARGFELSIVCALEQGTPPPFAIWGPELFFGCVDMLGRAASTLATGSPESIPLASYTHPPPATRRSQVHSIIKETFGDGPNIMASSVAVRLILEYLWAFTEPFWVKMHRKGMRPVPIW